MAGTRSDLALLARRLADEPDVDAVTLGSGRPSLFDRRKCPVLSVVPAGTRPAALWRGAWTRSGGTSGSRSTMSTSAPRSSTISPTPSTRSHRWSAGPLSSGRPNLPRRSSTPPRRCASQRSRSTSPGNGGAASPLFDGRIGTVRLGDVTLEGPEEDLLRALVDELARSDPDVLLTEGGDGFDLPWLYRRAAACGLSPAEFPLGRERVPFRPSRPARSFESYGRILYRFASYPLPGRFHVDRENSFLYRDADIAGLVDAARLSRLSLTTVVRQSPGTCFTAMEMARALELGVHVPWKKNRPEGFRRADQLVAADRGGVIFLPPVGIHDHVDEFDFASLYPHIMVTKNLSAETLECRCCPLSPLRAPGLGYRSCTRRVGLIPRTLAPLIARRLRLAYQMDGRSPRMVVRLPNLLTTNLDI